MELSPGFACSTLIEEGGYFPSFPKDISAILDEFNANIKDDISLMSMSDKELLQQNFSKEKGKIFYCKCPCFTSVLQIFYCS